MSVSQFTASAGVIIDGVTFSSGTVDVDGAADGIKLDANGDTTISSSTDDTIEIKIGGSVDFTLTANTFTLATGSEIAGPSSTVGVFIPIKSQEAVSGAGAMSITRFYSAWTTTGANAGTLADGTVKGQLKKVQLVVDGGDGTLTPSNLDSNSTITFADAGDFALLAWDGNNWVAIELGNDADGATAPVMA